MIYSLAFPKNDLIVSYGDNLLCLRANMNLCSDGLFV